MDEELKKKIMETINSKRVFLFMKGTPLSPQCGFSGRVVDTEFPTHYQSGFG